MERETSVDLELGCWKAKASATLKSHVSLPVPLKNISQKQGGRLRWE